MVIKVKNQKPKGESRPLSAAAWCVCVFLVDETWSSSNEAVTTGPPGPSSSAGGAANASPGSSSGLGLVAQSRAWQSHRNSVDFSPDQLAWGSWRPWPRGPRTIWPGFLLQTLGQLESGWPIHPREQVPKSRQNTHQKKHFLIPFCYLINTVQKIWALSCLSRWKPSLDAQQQNRACPPHHTQAASLGPPQSPDFLLTSPQSSEPSPPSTPSSLPLWLQRMRWVLFFSKASPSSLTLASFSPFFLLWNHLICQVFLAAPSTWPMKVLKSLLS